ncbi:hypothetical protein COU76_01925, partial [Candidatus Peregrinibacteria bacterium CG10_big_fil_rev_8_21_14_0_10_49_10]
MQSSLHYIWDYLLQPLFTAARVRTIVEIGTHHGECTRDLLHYCKTYGGAVHSLDVHEHPEVAELRKEFSNILYFHKGYSLNTLPLLEHYDAVIIDGSHNWYTVYNELLLIQKYAQKQGVFPLVVLHDVEWPYARRDTYCDPESIPDFFRHAWKKGGMKPGSPELLDHGGFLQQSNHAIYEGTARNGVLTAVEDFLTEHSNITYTHIPGFFGIGMLVDTRTLEQNTALQSFLNTWSISAPIHSHIRCIEHARIDAIMLPTTKQQLLEENLKNAIVQYADIRQKYEQAVKQSAEQRQKYEQAVKQSAEQRQKYEQAVKQSANQQNVLHHIQRTRSWRWTLWIRILEKWLRERFRPQELSLPSSPPSSFAQAFSTYIEQPAPPLQLSQKEIHPVVSIIIPVYNQWKYTAECLQSIQQYSYQNTYEIIVVDDASTDETSKQLQRLSHVTVLHQDTNQGFVAACNRGAQAARGEYLVFLNNDCVVQEGWLDALMHTFQTHAKAGLVGVKLLNRDGTLQEAGGAVYFDGNATNIGRGKDPDDPAFSYLR